MNKETILFILGLITTIVGTFALASQITQMMAGTWVVDNYHDFLFCGNIVCLIGGAFTLYKGLK